MTLPVPNSYIVDDANYSRTLQEVPIIADNANIYVNENITQNIYNSTVKIVSPDYVTANAVATEPPPGRQIGATYFDAIDSKLYVWNGTQWYKIGENLQNTVNGNVNIIGNLVSNNFITGNINSGNIVNGGTIVSSNTITGANIISLGLLQAIGNISGGNVQTSGDVTGTNVVATGNISGVTITASGNVNGGAINSTGNVAASGTVSGSNMTTTGTVTSVYSNTANLTVSSDANLQGPITFGTLPNITAGTANTVLYLNAAKTMTSGPELSFDGSNLGIGIQPATANLDVNGNGRIRANLDVFATGDGLTIAPGAAGFGATITSRNQSFSGITPLNVDASPALIRPNGLTANALYVSTTGIGANTVLPVSEMDINGVLSVTRGLVAPVDLRPNDDASVNWRLGAHTTAMKQGVLQIQNNGTGAGGGGTEVLTIDQQNNYGVGTVGAVVQYNTNNPNARINVNGSITGGTATSTSGSVILQGRNGATGSYTNLGTEGVSGAPVISYGMIPTAAAGSFSSSLSTVLSRSAITVSDAVRVYTSPATTAAIGAALTTTNVFTIANDGKVGIQKAAPLSDLDVDGNAMINLQVVGDYSGVRGAGGGNASLMLQSNQTTGTPFWLTSKTDNTLHIGGVGVAEPAQGAMVIDSGGNVVVGSGIAPYKFSVIGVTNGRTLYSLADSGVATDVPITSYNAADVGDNVLVEFITDSTPASRGSITFNRAAVLMSYNTTSDYRAKDIIGPVIDPGKTVDSLRVYTGRMHGATVERPMLVAHEAQEVAPYSVTGEKDAVDAEGNPIYQQVDHSSLVPLLIAEIQALRKRISALENNQ